MSMAYWTIDGVGIRAEDLQPFIDCEKLNAFLMKKFEIDEGDPILDDSTLDDFLNGEPYDNFAELLSHCDDSNILTYADNGDCEYSYLYYPPTMPWNRRENEPTSPEEVHEFIAAAVSKICNIPREKLDELIDDELNVEGCG